MAAISAHGLERAFKGGIKAVDGIDLDIPEGEIYGFLGPNGAGKTTTVRMLVTLLKPTGGSATVAGHDVASNPGAVRSRIGVALQEAALDPLMTGNELMALQATLQGMRGQDAANKCVELIERVGLTDAADRRVGGYSGGMKRRLDLALALVHSPSVLFLDEPTTGLDPTSRFALWREVSRLRDEGTTVFLTTQYLEEADQLADRVGIICDGRIVAEGTPDGLKSEVGASHIEIALSEGVSAAAAEAALANLGTPMPATGRHDVSIRLKDPSTGVADAVRVLDDAGLSLDEVELVRPSLDDVFLEKTGHRLEGASDSPQE
ncbi:MAG: ATP-binding cassette domain-containing protein [Actinomycetes bacterium]